MAGKLKVEKTKQFLQLVFSAVKKIPWFLGRHAFLVILILIAIDLILGALTFYKYVHLIKASQPQSLESQTIFKDGVYREILKDWENREHKLQNGNAPNSF